MTTSYHQQMALAQKRARKHAKQAIAAMKNGEEYGTARVIPDQAFIRKTIKNIFKHTVEGIDDSACQSHADRIFQRAYNQASMKDEVAVWDSIVQAHKANRPDVDEGAIVEYAVKRLTKDFRRSHPQSRGTAMRKKKSNAAVVKLNSHVRKVR